MRIMDPAETIIRKCGDSNFARGVNRISLWTGVKKSGIYRWALARAKGGRDGVIPAQHHQKILDGARREDIALAPEDFFASSASKPAAQEPLPPKKRRRDDVIILVSGVKTPFAYLNGEKVELSDIKRHIRDLERDAA
jgi:hypothetical protein